MKKLYIISVVLILGCFLCANTASADTDGTQPKLIVTDYALDTDSFMSGDSAILSISIHNTNSSRSVRNIKLSISDTVNEIFPVDNSSIIHSYIGPDEVFEWNIELSALETASDTLHILNIEMEYEDRYGRAYTCEDSVIIDVIQPVRLEYSEIDMPVRLTQGDVFPLEMNLMNMGKGDIYNALLTFDIKGIANGGSVLVGNLKSGETKQGKTNFRVSNEVLGNVTGEITITYEDSRGRLYEEVISVSTLVQEKLAIDYNKGEEEQKKEETYDWKPLAIAFISLSVVLMIVCAVTLIKSRNLRRDYENKL